MRLPISKDRQCNMNREVNNVTKRPRIRENTLNVYPYDPFQSPAASLHYSKELPTPTLGASLYFITEDNLHFIMSYNIHRHFINVFGSF